MHENVSNVQIKAQFVVKSYNSYSTTTFLCCTLNCKVVIHLWVKSTN